MFLFVFGLLIVSTTASIGDDEVSVVDDEAKPFDDSKIKERRPGKPPIRRPPRIIPSPPRRHTAPAAATRSPIGAHRGGNGGGDNSGCSSSGSCN